MLGYHNPTENILRQYSVICFMTHMLYSTVTKKLHYLCTVSGKIKTSRVISNLGNG